MLNQLLAGMNCTLATILLTAENYDLVILDDENVPMAAAPTGGGMPTYIPYVILIAVILVLLAAAVYVTDCNKYRLRLNTLYKKAGVSTVQGFTLSKSMLKEKVNDMETSMVDVSLDL